MLPYCRCTVRISIAVFVMAITCLAYSTLPARAGDYRIRKTAGPYFVDAAINRNPPILGANDITVVLRDRSSRSLTGARVLVNYSMPPMPGMVPMNYTVGATPCGNGYRARMNFIMTGPWNIAIRFEIEGNPWRVVLPIDVR